MNFDFIENLNEEQLINEYQDVIEPGNAIYIAGRCCTLSSYPYMHPNGINCCASKNYTNCMSAMYCK